jgi:DNA-binding GntR family transcriptional regulator
VPGLPGSGASPPATRTGQVVETLRQAIVAGTLAAGTPLGVADVAADLGVSATPVREALTRLEREGLVVVRPFRGAQVVRLDVEDLRRLLELREALDGMAARLAAERMTDDERAALRAAFAAHADRVRATQRYQGVRQDLEFHALIRAGARNGELSAAAQRLQDRIEVALRNLPATETGWRDLVDGHRALLDAIERRDPDAAEAAARAHVRVARKSLIESDGRTVTDAR